MNIQLIKLITQISNRGKHLIYRIGLTRSITTSTEMRRRHRGFRNSDYGRLAKKPLKKRSGKDVQKQGHASEDRFFHEQQQRQLEQLKKALSNMKVTARNKDKIKLTVVQPGLDDFKKMKTASDIFDDIAIAAKIRKAKEKKGQGTSDPSSSTGPKNTGK